MTKSKAVFPTDDSLFNVLYLAMLDITKKWTGRRQDWAQTHCTTAAAFPNVFTTQLICVAMNKLWTHQNVP